MMLYCHAHSHMRGLTTCWAGREISMGVKPISQLFRYCDSCGMGLAKELERLSKLYRNSYCAW